MPHYCACHESPTHLAVPSAQRSPPSSARHLSCSSNSNPPRFLPRTSCAWAGEPAEYWSVRHGGVLHHARALRWQRRGLPASQAAATTRRAGAPPVQFRPTASLLECARPPASAGAPSSHEQPRTPRRPPCMTHPLVRLAAAGRHLCEPNRHAPLLSCRRTPRQQLLHPLLGPFGAVALLKGACLHLKEQLFQSAVF